VRAELGALARRAASASAALAAAPSSTGPVNVPAAPPKPAASTGPLTVWEKEALRRLAALPAPITLEAIEQLDLGPGTPPMLDVAQVLVERGLLLRTADGGFVVA
jgi:hypothetical protein